MSLERIERPAMATRALARLEAVLSKIFDGANNPLHHLGALTIYFCWVALVSGIYLFVFYRINLEGAWESVEYLTREQWYAGGIMRSLHRYASDAAVVTMVLHLFRELLRARLTGPRWFSWLTGLPVIWILLFFGITGYWMVWDELAQYVAIQFAQLLDRLPIFTDPMTRNFISNDAVSSRLFTLIAFIHLVGLPIVIVLAIWFHLLRIKLPNINPPRLLMFGSLGALLLLSLVMPVFSHAPADLDRVPLSLDIDWFFLAMFPLQEVTSAGLVWALGTGGTFLLAALPWLIPSKRQPVAQVNLPNCTGCGFCAEDCPYGAIDMVPRSDGRNHEWEAKVNPSLCVSCGICTGSCPTSSPFRTRDPLQSGIEMPQATMDAFRREMIEKTASESNGVVVFGCDHGVNVDKIAAPGVHSISRPCVGMVPPSAIDYALRKGGYAGVVIAGCDSCDCHHRLGEKWTLERLARERQPSLRGRVPRERVLTNWSKVGQEGSLAQAVAAFRQQLGSMAPPDRQQDETMTQADVELQQQLDAADSDSPSDGGKSA